MEAGPPDPLSSPPRSAQAQFPWGARPRTEPDPGSRRLAWLFTIAAIVLIGVVAWIQQTAQSPAVKSAGQPPLAPAAAPPAVQITFFAKAGVKIYHALTSEKDDAQSRQQLAHSIVENVRTQAADPYDKLRAAIVAGDLLGPEEAIDRLGAIKPEAIAADPDLERDIATVRTLYRGNEPDAAAVAALIDRHGWFGELASTRDLPEASDKRQAVIGGGLALAAVLLVFVGVIVLAMIAGFVLLIIGIVKAATGTLPTRFTPPLPGGSAPIETVAVFVLGFIGLKGATMLVAQNAGPRTAMMFPLFAQWALALVIFYPLLRGVPRDRWLYLIGLHKGRGVLREMGAGFLGYLATLPILLGGAIVLIAAVAIKNAIEQAAAGGVPIDPEPLQNPILEIVGGAHGPFFVLLFFSLASLWAPLVEEAIFRGCLYRHFRGVMHFLPAGILTAMGFGLMHGYPILLLSPVISLGFGFALIREWRGSIIACMTAHCIHNATIVVALVTILNLAGV